MWETPLFPEETADRLEAEQDGVHFDRYECAGVGYGQMNLLPKYVSDDAKEEAPCDFLDPDKGCMLSAQDKPFDCKIWPLRIMEKDGKQVIALTPTCPTVNAVDREEMRTLVESGLGNTIFAYAKEHPYIVKEYKKGFPVLMEFAKN